jgi:hypothetical protein
MDLKPGAGYKFKRQRLPSPRPRREPPKRRPGESIFFAEGRGHSRPQTRGLPATSDPLSCRQFKLRESCGSASFSSFGCRPPPGFTSPFVPQQSLSPLYGANYSAMSLARAPFTKRMMAERAEFGARPAARSVQNSPARRKVRWNRSPSCLLWQNCPKGQLYGSGAALSYL